MPDLASLQGITGTLDGSGVEGQADIRLAPHKAVSANLHFARLDLDDWLGPARPRFGTALADMAAPFAVQTTKLQVTADTAVAAGATWSTFALAASTGASGLVVDRASAEAAGVKLKLSGAFRPDGTIGAARLLATAPSLNATRAVLGAGAAWVDMLPALPGPVSLRVFADGPPNALTVQVHAETDDLTAEAESRRDTIGGTANTTVTLRHPGASFLLDGLGARQSEAWLGQGPLALLAHVVSAPGIIRIPDVALSAGELRLAGHGVIGLSGKPPSVDLDLMAPALTVPSLSTVAVPPFNLPALLSNWQGEIRLKADHVEAGLAPVGGALTATLAAGARNAVLVVNAGGGGAEISLAAAADASASPSVVSLRAAITAAPSDQPAGVPLRLSGGRLRLDLDLSASGDTTPALLDGLSGEANLVVRNTDIGGIDLPMLTRLLSTGLPASRGTMLPDLIAGVSDNVSGSLQARFDHGRLSIGDNGFSSIDGSFRLSGTADFVNGSVDITNTVQPAVADAATMQVHYAGAPGAVKANADPRASGDATSRQEKPRKPRAGK
jgi:hypothetical protein